ncbi:MAG: hypothetical protein KatS3mg108_2534 [Isosphaeraceae bacterium]|jgi:hypothetical protein|nr:MAG: hypothetical protein KatS3mg108_2534 [Isosphaeraceae bacterium]
MMWIDPISGLPHPLDTILRPVSPRQAPPSPPWLVSTLAVALAIVPTGCSEQSNREPVYPVTGRVLFEGQPAFNAFVIFHPAPGSPPNAQAAHGKADEQGDFRLSTYNSFDGAHAGLYRVSIIWPELTEDLEDGPDRLNGRFANPASSPFQVEVKPGQNTIPPFELGR